MDFEALGYQISTDKSKLDLQVIHEFLFQSYWAKGIPREVVEKSIAGSLCFGLYHNDQQIGFARMVTDSATFAYLGDVFVLEPYRGKGLSKWLMQRIMQHPELQGLRRMILATLDAHGLYKQFGFEELSAPDRLMEKLIPNIYQSNFS